MQNNQNRIHNIEFKIAFCETNLRYLHGEPNSERKNQCIELNRQAIAEAKRELDSINHATSL